MSSLSNVAIHDVVSFDMKQIIITALNTVYKNDPRNVVKQGVASALGRIPTDGVPTGMYRIIINDAEYDCILSGCENVLSVGAGGVDTDSIKAVRDFLTK